MRLMKYIVALGLVLAVTVPAGAVPAPIPTTPAVWHLTDYDMGVLYTGMLAGGVTPVTPGVVYAPAALQQVRDGNLQAGEDTWGIVQIDQIMSGAVTGPNSVTPTGVTYYDKNLSSMDIVGIFYGRRDVAVRFFDMGGVALTQQIKSTGGTYEIFTQPKNQFGGDGVFGNLGAGARVGLNQYPGIGFGVAGAEEVLTGFTQTGMEAYDFISTFTPALTRGGTGSFDTYITMGDITAPLLTQGTQNALYDFGPGWPAGGFVPFVPLTTADLHMTGQVMPTNYNWLVRSSDPLMQNLVPEPVSMAVIAVGGMAMLLRRRRRRTA